MTVVPSLVTTAGRYHHLYRPRHATPRHEVEWHECAIKNHHRPPMRMYWMDWSVSSKLEIQYQPSVALESFLSSSSQPDRHPPAVVPTTTCVLRRHQQRAMQQFVAGPARTVTHHPCTGDEDIHHCAVNFHSALCYWQHPAIHPLPDALLFGTTKTTTASSSSSSQPKPRASRNFGGGKPTSNHPTSTKTTSSIPTELLFSSSNSNSNSHHSRMAMPPPKKHMRAFTTTTTNNSNHANTKHALEIRNETLVRTRISEWQAAFQSLYFGWTDQIRRLNQQWMELSSSNDDNIGVDDFYNQVSETYFYAIGKGQTILFRVGVLLQNENRESVVRDHTAPTSQLVPEIILSSSSQSLRNKLRSMNVTLHLLYEWNCQTGVFEDEWLYRSSPSGANSNPIHRTTEPTGSGSTSPNVMAELIALRRQQMTRWRVGPDIAVMMKPKSRSHLNQYTPSPKGVPPLRVTGKEQCATFFDLYYHSLGQVGATNYVENFRVKELTFDIPLLICRKIGPSLHASIQSNDVTKREPPVGTDKMSSNATLDLSGYFLPCAIRDLTCAMVDAMQVRKNASDDVDHGHDACHFVIQTTVHPGNELKNVSGLGAIGTQCSKRLNGSWNFLDAVSDKIDIQCCHHDEVLRLAVWDESRPTSLAIKLHHEPALL